MCFVVHASLDACIKKVNWHGRAGALHLFDRPNPVFDGLNVVVVGIHGAHGDELEHSLADASVIQRCFPRNAQRFFFGDWNVDQMPSFAQDPFVALPRRESHHRERRDLLVAWASAHKLCLQLPQCDLQRMPECISEELLFSGVPFTRMPQGLQDAFPSCLDYAFSSSDFVSNSSFSWRDVPGDHAIVAFVCELRFNIKARRKMKWRPSSIDQSISEMGAVTLYDTCSARDLHKQLIEVQASCEDRRSCAERRHDRMPQELRDTYHLLATEVDPRTVLVLRKKVWQLRKKWVADARLQSNVQRVQDGRVLRRSKRLHSISSIVVDGEPSQDRELWASSVQQFFEKKWGVDTVDVRKSCLDFISSCDQSPLEIEIEHIANAFKRLRNKLSLDLHGVARMSLEYLFLAQPENFRRWLACFAVDRHRIAELEIHARAYGKTKPDTVVDDIRVILPLPCILSLLDAMLPFILESYITNLFPEPAGVWFGARPSTQVLDITHGLSCVIEKGLDSHSKCAIGQADIRAYYDSINLLRVFNYLVEHGVPSSLAGACLSHQLLPWVYIDIGQLHIPIGARSVGSLTGSRLAGVAARVPVYEVCCRRSQVWEQWGFETPTATLTMCTYVDNLFTASKSAHMASLLLQDAADELMSTWSLSIKPSSRMIMVADGADDHSTCDPDIWPICTNMEALGHLLENDGSVNACFTRTVRNMWKSFFGNCSSYDAKKLPIKCRLQLLRRAVVPILRFRWTRWPFTITRARQLDRLQRRMLSIVIAMRPLASEDCLSFIRRRNRAVSSLQRSTGVWSTQWAQGLVGWDDHLQRDRNFNTWSAHLRHLLTPEYLERRRLLNGRRPATRNRSGWICARWFEQVNKAKAYIAQRE